MSNLVFQAKYHTPSTVTMTVLSNDLLLKIPQLNNWDFGILFDMCLALKKVYKLGKAKDVNQ